MTSENNTTAFEAIIKRLNNNGRMEELLREHGLDTVYDTIEDVSSLYDDIDELGSSDVSILVKRVESDLDSKVYSSGLSF